MNTHTYKRVLGLTRDKVPELHNVPSAIGTKGRNKVVPQGTQMTPMLISDLLEFLQEAEAYEERCGIPLKSSGNHLMTCSSMMQQDIYHS